MKRREFLKSSALMSSAAVLGVPHYSHAAAEKATIQVYNEIGKTGIKMSDISFGCGKLSSASLIARAMNRGINYFDTSPDYGDSEEVLGEAIKKLKKRDKMIIASKFCDKELYPGHLPLGSKKLDFIKVVDGSLSRLNTDYLDICFVHAIGEGTTLFSAIKRFIPGMKASEKKRKEEEKRLFDENLLSAVDTLKKSGKIRFLAVSSHGPHFMEELMTKAVTSGHYDLIMPAFNFMKFPKIPSLLLEAKKNNVGVIAMKTLAGAKDMSLDPKGESFEHAVFKWTLKHQGVNGLVITIKSIDELDHYVKASGKEFMTSDQALLDQYKKLYTAKYCRTGCGECLDSCSSNVNIATILRYQMYFQDYGMEKKALEGYASLRQKADVCNSCLDTPCEKACPYGLPISSMLQTAHNLLSFNA
ncbi:MAG TPA: aldo/keto reductase [Nitrospinota bacterium]|nr:aldo/keto reductase [Nitrospinota bacterium]